MEPKHDRDQDTRRHREQGITMLWAAFGLVTFLGFAAFTIDMGIAYTARTQAQAAVDGIALSAAASMIDLGTNPPSVDQATSQSDGILIASKNRAYPNASLTVDADSFTYGTWNFDTRSLDPPVDADNASQTTGVRVALNLNDGLNQSVPAFFSTVLGRDSFNVGCSATAYLGFAGDVGPGEVDLPIAIPCCALLNGDVNCAQSYCAGGVPPVPNPCPLLRDPSITASCIEFSSTPEQNACWTEFDGSSTAINPPGLSTIVDNANSGPIESDDNIYVDNGEKTPVIGDIKERFENLDIDPVDGKPDYDTDGDGAADSWIVQMPVVNCQNQNKCAHSTTAPVKGFVCAEVVEVALIGSNKTLRVNFICPQSDPIKYAKCLGDGRGSGGDDFGIRVTIPVLVR